MSPAAANVEDGALRPTVIEGTAMGGGRCARPWTTLRPILAEMNIDPGEPEMLELHNIIKA